MRKNFLMATLVLSIWAGKAEARDYNIVAYGAKADTTVLSTKALQQAIDDCAKAGGGRVVVPTGQYKIGSIVLKSDVHLYLEATMWGNLPAKGFYLRHTRNVNFDNIEVITKAPDARPDFVRSDTEESY